jgi:hypothetical protein
MKFIFSPTINLNLSGRGLAVLFCFTCWAPPWLIYSTRVEESKCPPSIGLTLSGDLDFLWENRSGVH